MFSRIKADITAVKDRDPACPSTFSALTNYPGLRAVWWHRLTHRLHRSGYVWLARYISQRIRRKTGVEIHPGATIGDRFFIDHGMGVVIGETSVIGNDVTLFQGVTLGGTGKEHGKRHPTIEDFVVVGVGATVLGNITVGRGSRVGAGAVVISDVPPNSTVVGVPGRVVVREGRRVEAVDLHHEDLPDPLVEMYRSMARRIDRLEARVSSEEDRRAESGLLAPGAADDAGDAAPDAREDDDGDPRL